jgi:ribonuclease BN (tRNA processing enzyme)
MDHCGTSELQPGRGVMRLRVLGCSGSIGGQHHRTTSFLVDHDILIDAGTGVGDLSLAELVLIDHIFVTHSHLDHVNSIAFFLDSVGALRPRPVTVYALGATIETLKKNLFNWDIWPDFTVIPAPEQPALRYEEIEVGRQVVLDGRKITVLPAIHTVPAVGYQLDSGRGSLVFTGDTGPNDALWNVVNRIENLRFVIIETAFSDKDQRLAELALHLCPSLLAGELAKLRRPAEVYITHLKPSEIELTMQEIEELPGDVRPRMLQNNHVFEF